MSAQAAEGGSGSKVELERYTGTWDDDDRDAAFKSQVAEYTRNDPWPTIQTLSRNTGIPEGALVRYVLVRWTGEGSEALLALGPRLVQQLWDVTQQAEIADSDDARLAAYTKLRNMLSWLRVPLDED